MRRVLIDRARLRNSIKFGGKAIRTKFDEDALGDQASDSVPPELLLALDDGLELLAKENPTAADLVQLRYFAGLTIEQGADVLGISERTANQYSLHRRAKRERTIAPVWCVLDKVASENGTTKRRSGQIAIIWFNYFKSNVTFSTLPVKVNGTL